MERYFGRYRGGDPLEGDSYTLDEELPPPTESSCFDLASLTKFLATAPLVLHLIEAGDLTLETAIGEILNGLPRQTAVLTIKELLTHSSGLPALPDLWHDRSPDVDARDAARAQLYTIEPTTAPGEKITYSCTGFIFLGEIIETVYRRALTDVFSDITAAGPSLRHGRAANFIGFQPPPTVQTSCVPTEWCAWRRRRVHGTVHDENAHILGGAAGNAGLFGTLPAVHDHFLRVWGPPLGAGVRRTYLSEETAHRGVSHRCVLPLGEALHDRPAGSIERRGLGMQITPKGGPRFGPDAFGHTGFTGTSIWGDPESGLAVTILTSRLYYGRDTTTTELFEYRRRVHESVLDRYGSSRDDQRRSR